MIRSVWLGLSLCALLSANGEIAAGINWSSFRGPGATGQVERSGESGCGVENADTGSRAFQSDDLERPHLRDDRDRGKVFDPCWLRTLRLATPARPESWRC